MNSPMLSSENSLIMNPRNGPTTIYTHRYNIEEWRGGGKEQFSYLFIRKERRCLFPMAMKKKEKLEVKHNTSPSASDITFFHSPEKVSSIAHCSFLLLLSHLRLPTTHSFLSFSSSSACTTNKTISLTFVLCFHNDLWHFTRRLLIIINQK